MAGPDPWTNVLVVMAGFAGLAATVGFGFAISNRDPQLAVAGALLAVVCGLLVRTMVSRRRRIERLVRDGVRADAEILEIGAGGMFDVVICRFEVDAQTYIVRRAVQPGELEPDTKQVTVAYDRRHPRRAAIVIEPDA